MSNKEIKTLGDLKKHLEVYGDNNFIQIIGEIQKDDNIQNIILETGRFFKPTFSEERKNQKQQIIRPLSQDEIFIKFIIPKNMIDKYTEEEFNKKFREN